jgi:hypothetical protein
MDSLDKLNNLLSQIDSRIEQIDEDQLTEEKMNILKEYRNNVGKNKNVVYHDDHTGAIHELNSYSA